MVVFIVAQGLAKPVVLPAYAHREYNDGVVTGFYTRGAAMRSIALVALGVLLGVVVMLAVPHGPPQVVYASSPCGNGDVNGDGRVDIADGIYIINYQLRGGPPPVAIECTGSSLPATGQTTCYGDVACDSAEHPGQDGFYQKGCPMAGRFVDNGDGTVTDNCTGLMWQKDTARGGYTWQQALKYCERLEFAGHDDWRLPNVRELVSIVDYGRINPSIDPVFQVSGGMSPRYWSSSHTVSLSISTTAWCAEFGTSLVFQHSVSAFLLVRAVRDAD